MSNQVLFMTGATSGLGKVSALRAAQKGATVIVLARNPTKSAELLKDFKTMDAHATGNIEIVAGDLSDFGSLVQAFKQIVQKHPVIDQIINNAGIMQFEPTYSSAGIELTLQVNLLAPLLLCYLLYPSLRNSQHGKIIFTASALHTGEIDFDDLERRQKEFTSFKVYRQSKLGVILVCRYLAKVLDAEQIGIYTQHPGLVKTELGRSAGWFSKLFFNLMGKSAAEGSETLTYLIETPKDELKPGEYYADKAVKETSKESYDMKVAAQLIAVCQNYLSDYIKTDSPIFSSKG